MSTALDVARWPPWLRDRPGSVSPSSSAPTLRIPGAAGAPWLDTRVYLALGADLSQSPMSWSWVDISNYVRFASGITTTQGRPDESATVRTSSASLVLDNTDGRFSRKNPLGPYYGLLSRNTPIWGTVDAGTGAKTRLAMFVNEWPSRWDQSANDATVPIQCAGIMRRLAQGTVLKSPLQRAAMSATLAAAPVAFWPLEDATGSTQAASGLPRGTPMTVRGSVAFGTATPPAGASAAPDFSAGGSLSAPLAGLSSTGFRVEFAAKNPVTAEDGTLGLVRVMLSGGTFASIVFNTVHSDIGEIHVYGVDASGTVLTNLAATLSFQANTWAHYSLGLTQVGADVIPDFYVNGVAAFNILISGVGVTLGTPTQILVNNAPVGSGTSVVGLAVYPPIGHTAAGSAMTGYVGETAVARIVRLCAEERVRLLCTGATAPSPAMGPQPIAAFLDILRDAETVDQGVLYETDWGLGYQTLFERTNRSVSMALDMNLGQLAAPPEPADDDQRLRNRWKAARSGGSEAIAELTTGQLGTGPGGPGLYDDSVTANVQSDSQLLDQAGWRLHRDTIDEDRYPSVAIALHNIPAFIDTWASLPWGARITVAHPPGQMAPDLIDAIVEGWSEQWDQILWTANLNTAPYSTYRVGTLAADVGDVSPTLLILTPDTLTLAAAVDTTATSWQVNSSPLWTTNSEMFPRRIMWDGEEISLTNCVGGSAPQTWTVIRSINGIAKAHAAGSTGRIINPGVLSLA